MKVRATIAVARSFNRVMIGIRAVSPIIPVKTPRSRPTYITHEAASEEGARNPARADRGRDRVLRADADPLPQHGDGGGRGLAADRPARGVVDALAALLGAYCVRCTLDPDPADQGSRLVVRHAPSIQ